MWVHEDDLTELETSAGTVVTTEDHPFWNDTGQQWQEVEEFDAGKSLLTAGGGAVSVVRLDSSSVREDTAYNLTVERLHTYYVLINDTAVLVQNTGGCDRDADRLSHVEDRHTLGGAGVDSNAGIFDPGQDLQRLANGTAGQIGVRNPATGNIEYGLRSNQIIGTTRAASGGVATNTYTVVRDPYGGLVTMYPSR